MALLAGLLAVVSAVHSSTLQPGERLLFYPALAQAAPDGWEILVHGLVYEPERRRLMAVMLRRVLGLDDGRMSAAERATCRQRCAYFLVTDQRDKRLSVLMGNERLKLGTSAANGHCSARWRWPTNNPALAQLLRGASNGVLRVELSVDQSAGPPAQLEIHCLSETGWSVISDIDDTIKVTNVRDRHELLANTFSRPFQPVAGMAELYQHWARTQGTQFHYVTASPWQLYEPLAGFARSNGFPAGTFHMKEFRVKDGSVMNLFTSPKTYKPSLIEPLLRQFPKRQFILVGDSGEQDPEVYGALARKHPGQIRRIFIRNVTGEGAERPRYRAAFGGLPRDTWQIFDRPSEIRQALER